jgi:hypothetical protein
VILHSNPEEIARAFSLLFQPGDICELRAPRTKRQGTISGYFDNPDALIKAVTSLNGAAPGIYLTMNRIARPLLSRAANHITSHAIHTTADKDIERRQWLLIDIDSTRPAGISSTDSEHEAAIALAREIRAVLSEEDWPTPVLADSGNGAHLLFRIDFPNTDSVTKLVKRVLEALARRFDNEQLKIDCSVYNAARILKLYGTVVAKGDNLPSRPHRLSHILEVPAALEPVPLALLEQLAGHAVPPPRDPPRQSRSTFDIEVWIHEHNLRVRTPVAYKGGRKWELEICPFNDAHKNSAAIFETADASPAFRCLHNSCTDNRWHQLRELVEGPAPRTAREEATDDRPTLPQWPDPLAEDAFHGVTGQLVQVIGPHTESDPAALLVQFLVGWGSLAGRGPYYLAEADYHHTNEYAVLLGATAKGRKGTSLGRIRAVLGAVDHDWNENRLIFGLGSGEALIEAAGEEDRRSLILETEFARLLAIISREGSTISASLRNGWDNGILEIRTRQKKVKVAGAHLSLIGHITREEALRRLDDTEIANGLANRILWICAKRSKVLPHGGGSPDLAPVIRQLTAATAHARRLGNTRVKFDAAARQLWEAVYPGLSEGRPGLFGSLTSRAEAHVVRLALEYALLDCSAEISAEHLRAALAVWRYCEASVRFVWGDALGDPVADEILRALREAGDNGLTRWDLMNHFSRHKPAELLDRALGVLAERGLIKSASEDTGGRPVVRYRVV